MIFPERVLGSSEVKMMSSGRASAPMRRTTCCLSSSARRGSAGWPRVTEVFSPVQHGTWGDVRLALFLFSVATEVAVAFTSERGFGYRLELTIVDGRIVHGDPSDL